MKITKKFLNNLTRDPLAILNELSDDEIVVLLQKARFEYFIKGEPIFADNIYDLVKEALAIRDPEHPLLNAIGASIQEGKKVKLPYFMGSLDKIKGEVQIQKFAANYSDSYIVSDKLDGNSALLCGGILYSRGDGIEGQDISHLLPFIRGIPKKVPKTMAIRGELIIGRQEFEKVKDRGANARNMVAGLINAKVPDLGLLKLVEFVAYELVHPKEIPETQFQMLTDLGFKVVFHEVLNKLENTRLSEILVSRRKDSEFEIDGIVVMHNAIHKRTQETPKYAFAFKSILTMEETEVIVGKVHWNVSKDSYLKPVIEFPAVKLAGVSIQRATGFNGKFILDNKIGPGSTLVIIRSGDVIPTIKQVLTPSSNGNAQMPDIPYIWTSTGVDIIASDATDEVELKNIEHFFATMTMRGISKGTVKKLYEAGHKSVHAILNIKKEQLLDIPTFKDKSAQNFLDGIAEGIKNVECIKLMDASNMLGRGFGQKKLKLILEHIPDILKTRELPSLTSLISIKGIEKKTAEAFLTNLPKFFAFYDSLGLSCTELTTVTSTLTGKVFVFSGFRDKELEEQIKKEGGEVATSISKRVTHLVLKDKNSESSKVTKAKELGIAIIDRNEIFSQDT